RVRTIATLGPTLWSRERPWRIAPQHAPREVLCRHGLCEQGALHQAEAQLTRGEKVGSILHAIGDGARANGIGEIDDSSAGRLLSAVAPAAGGELPGDPELDQGKKGKPPKRRARGAKNADRDGGPAGD